MGTNEIEAPKWYIVLPMNVCKSELPKLTIGHSANLNNKLRNKSFGFYTLGMLYVFFFSHLHNIFICRMHYQKVDIQD